MVLKHLRRAMIVGGVIGGGLFWLSTNSIQQTIEEANGILAENLRWFGFSDPPQALASTAADNTAAIAGLVLLILGVLAAASWAGDKITSRTHLTSAEHLKALAHRYPKPVPRLPMNKANLSPHGRILVEAVEALDRAPAGLSDAVTALATARQCQNQYGAFEASKAEGLNPIMGSAILSLERDYGLPTPPESEDWGVNLNRRFKYLAEIVPLLTGGHLQEAATKADELARQV